MVGGWGGGWGVRGGWGRSGTRNSKSPFVSFLYRDCVQLRAAGNNKMEKCVARNLFCIHVHKLHLHIACRTQSTCAFRGLYIIRLRGQTQVQIRFVHRRQKIVKIMTRL